MKKSTLWIVDARIKGELKAFRVKSVAANGEILQVSEVLNDKKAVKTHIKAMEKCWKGTCPVVVDKTKKQIFK